MGNNIYHGYKGGLYPNAQDVPPPAYLQEGLNHAAQVQPRNSNGQPDPTNGRIVLLSIGMSNTTMEFSVFKQIADADSHKNPKLVVVDGAVGGQDALTIRDPGS